MKKTVKKLGEKNVANKKKNLRAKSKVIPKRYYVKGKEFVSTVLNFDDRLSKIMSEMRKLPQKAAPITAELAANIVKDQIQKSFKEHFALLAEAHKRVIQANEKCAAIIALADKSENELQSVYMAIKNDNNNK